MFTLWFTLWFTHLCVWLQRCLKLLYTFTNTALCYVALKYTLSRFEVVGDSTELSSIQLSSTEPSSVQLRQLSSQAPALLGSTSKFN